MIERVQSYKVGDAFYNTFEEAQQSELHNLVATLQPDLDKSIVHSLTEQLLAHRAKVVDILTSTPKSRPKARKANGATKKRGRPSAATVNAALQDMKQ